MLRALTDFFGRTGRTGGYGAAAADTREHELQLATAILLVEIARADFDQDDAEIGVIRELLRAHLDLASDELEQLIEDAMREADHHATLQAFTRQLHEELGVGEKLQLVEMLWRVALADSVLDKHEDHLIRRIAGLLYVSHGDMIRVRNRVRDELG